MEGIGTLIAICFLLTFGTPLLFLIIGLVKRKTNKEMAKTFFILATAWFIIGGGICATIMMG